MQCSHFSFLYMNMEFHLQSQVYFTWMDVGFSTLKLLKIWWFTNTRCFSALRASSARLRYKKCIQFVQNNKFVQGDKFVQRDKIRTKGHICTKGQFRTKGHIHIPPCPAFRHYKVAWKVTPIQLSLNEQYQFQGSILPWSVLT